MAKVTFQTKLKKFGEQGEKTGWTYIEIESGKAELLMPGNKKSFRVSGKVDNYVFEKIALMPMGDGGFIMPLKAEIRKAIGKKQGDLVSVSLLPDSQELVPPAEFIECLLDEPKAFEHFKSLPKSHQHYFIRWIEQAKTDATKAKRIAQSVNALSLRMGFNIMLRTTKERGIK